MSGIHVVVGAGIVGSTLAELLANDGQDVSVVTRTVSELRSHGRTFALLLDSGSNRVGC